MYHETVTSLEEGPDTLFGNAGRGENSGAGGILNNSTSTAFPSWVQPISDSDSGDSLFLTQHDTQPVRTARRSRPEENALNLFTNGEPQFENEESSSPHRPWETPLKSKRRRNVHQRRQRKFSHKRLSIRKSLTCELGALGGFFKCMMKMKAEAAKVPKRSKRKRCPDHRRCISPVSDSHSSDGEVSEDEDIKIVDLREFVPKYKMARKGYNPWLEGNDAQGTTTEENKDASKSTANSNSKADSGSESLGSDSEAGSSESECSESESESESHRLRRSSSVSAVLDRHFSQDENQRRARRTSSPRSEIDNGVEERRTMRKDALKKQCAAALRPPCATVIQTEAGEKEGGAEHLPLQDLPAAQLFNPGDRGDSQSRETGGEEGSLWDASLHRHRELEGENEGLRAGAFGNSVGRKENISPLPQGEDEERGTREDEETSTSLQDGVLEESVTVPDFVPIETEHVEMDAVEDMTQSVEERLPAGLLRGMKRSEREEPCDEEPIDLPLVPAEEGPAGAAAELDPHTLPPRDCQQQTQDREYCSGAGNGKCPTLNTIVVESVGDSASGDVVCEKGVWKKKKKRKKDNNGNVVVNEPPSETFSDSVQLTQDKEKSSRDGGGGHSLWMANIPEPVGDSVSDDVIREEGKRKKKKRKKDGNGNMEVRVNEPPSELLCGSFHLTQDSERSSEAGVGDHSLLISSVPEPLGESSSGDVICEEGIRKKKKKREKNGSGSVEELENELPSGALNDSLRQMHGKEKTSRSGVGECSIMISSVSEPVGDSASGDLICDKGIRKKKKRKKDEGDNVEELENELPSGALNGSHRQMHGKEKISGSGVGECSIMIASVSEPVGDSASGDVICDKGIRKKKKKRKKDGGSKVEELENEIPSEDLNGSLRLTCDKEKTFGSGVGECSIMISSVSEPVGDSASVDVICEKGIRKKKKKREKNGSGNVEELENELPSEALNGSYRQTREKEKMSGSGVGECSIMISSASEPVGDSTSGSVICDEGIRMKKKKKKKDGGGNVEELENELPSGVLNGSLRLTCDKEKIFGSGVGECSVMISSVSEPVGDSASGDVICDEGIRKSKKKRKKDGGGKVEVQIIEPPSETLSGKKSGKKRKKDDCANAETQINERLSETLSGNVRLTQDGEKISETGVGDHSLLISSAPERAGESSGAVTCEEGIRQKKKKRKKDKNGSVEEYFLPSVTLSSSLYLTHDKEKSSEAGVDGEDSISNCNIPESVGVSDVICEEGIMKKKKKKKKKGKKDKNGNVEEHLNEPPSETFSGRLLQTQDIEKCSRDGGGECSVMITSVSEPLGDSTSGYIFCEEGIRKKKKRRKKDDCGIVVAHINEQPCATLSDGKSGKKRKKDDSGNVEVQINEQPSETLSGKKSGKKRKRDDCGNVEVQINEQPSDKDKDNNGNVEEHVNETPSPEIRKMKKKRKRGNCDNMEEQVGKLLPDMLEDSLHLMKCKEKSPGAEVMECSQLHSSIPEDVNSSTFCEVVCEERIRKKKKERKRDDRRNNVKPLSHSPRESKRQTKDKVKQSTPT